MSKKALIEKMTACLENMCAYHAIGNMKLFYYNAGEAGGYRELLEELYNWDEDNASEHIKAMFEIMEENW